MFNVQAFSVKHISYYRRFLKKINILHADNEKKYLTISGRFDIVYKSCEVEAGS